MTMIIKSKSQSKKPIVFSTLFFSFRRNRCGQIFPQFPEKRTMEKKRIKEKILLRIVSVIEALSFTSIASVP